MEQFVKSPEGGKFGSTFTRDKRKTLGNTNPDDKKTENMNVKVTRNIED